MTREVQQFFEKEWEVRHILLIPNRVRPDDESEELMISIRERYFWRRL